jgi:phosphatidylinositol glycan class B
MRIPWARCLEDRLFWLGLLVFGLSAYFSSGYFHPDEHFQVLEFAYARLGLRATAGMPWEYGVQARPAGLPMLSIFFFRRFGDPFWAAASLRFLTGMVSFGLYYGLSRTIFQERAWSNRVILCCIFLWFFPFLSVRFSAEQWSAITFLGGLFIFLTRAGQDSSRLVVGFLWGLSFMIRYQTGFGFLGIGLWLLAIDRGSWQVWIRLAVGFALGVWVGLWVDSLYYGRWVPTPWNYFREQVLMAKAAGFGKMPVYFFGTAPWVDLVPPVSLVLLVGFIRGCLLHRRQLLVWYVGFFILGHSIMAHKEMRFMIPVMYPVLVIAVWGWVDLLSRFGGRVWLRIGWRIALGVNLTLWVFQNFRPQSAFMPTYAYLYREASTKSVVVHSVEGDPYEVVGLPLRVYRPENLAVRASYDLDSIRLVPGRQNYLFHRRLKFPEAEARGYRRVHTALPPFLEHFDLNGWQGRSYLWSLYRFPD